MSNTHPTTAKARAASEVEKAVHLLAHTINTHDFDQLGALLSKHFQAEIFNRIFTRDDFVDWQKSIVDQMDYRVNMVELKIHIHDGFSGDIECAEAFLKVQNTAVQPPLVKQAVCFQTWVREDDRWVCVKHRASIGLDLLGSM